MKIKRSLILFLRCLHVLLEFILLYLIVGILSAYISVNRHGDKESTDVTIYLLSNGVHTDIVVPVQNTWMDWRTKVPFENTRVPVDSANFLAFGWGDKGFYLNTPTWSDLKFSTAFKAAFWLSESAMHTTYYQNLEEGENCVKLVISDESYKKLVTYIMSSFHMSNCQSFELIRTDAVYGDTDAFYEAKGTYSLFYTCNSWANEGLKAANQPASLWTLLQDGIFYAQRR